ncbi:amidase [Sulfolobus tengchongensis]|uniref:Amidase n=1 Tax=Sulfolobus tengchongensis TaxID=207809 RepID=A0AAX4L2F2_9CREN
MRLEKNLEKVVEENKKAELVNYVHRIIRGDLPPSELIYKSLNNIKEENAKFNSYITIIDPSENASILDKMVRMKHGDLIGIPIAVKDNIFTKNIRTTLASRIYKDFIPDYDADVIISLKNADALIIGKTNLHALAGGVSNVSSDFGPVKNPHNTERISGGSSGGSAVTVAYGSVPASLGTDTFGSIRIPASLCGVVGYKPSYNLISTNGLYPTAWSLDTIGVFTRSVTDASYLISVLTNNAIDFSEVINGNISKKLRLGYLVDERAEFEVESEFMRLLPILEDNGTEITKISMDLGKITSIARTIRLSESASFHYELFTQREQDYPKDIAELIRIGVKIPAHEYIRALRLRGEMLRGFLKYFNNIDAIITPTVPIVAPKIEDVREAELKFRDILTRYISIASFFGSPAISLPAGKINSLPWGIQLIGKPNEDEKLLKISRQIEMMLKYQ